VNVMLCGDCRNTGWCTRADRYCNVCPFGSLAQEADRLSKEVPMGVDLDYVRKAIPDLCDQAAELDELLIAVRDLIVAWDGAPTGNKPTD